MESFQVKSQRVCAKCVTSAAAKSIASICTMHIYPTAAYGVEKDVFRIADDDIALSGEKISCFKRVYIYALKTRETNVKTSVTTTWQRNGYIYIALEGTSIAATQLKFKESELRLGCIGK